MQSPLSRIVTDCAREVSMGLNEQGGFPPNYDQTIGNLCHMLTYYALERLTKGGLIVRRELHFDENDNWHYLLAHAAIDATPTDDDIISDLNPWQWRDFGGGILHGSRQDVMETLRTAGAPENVIALRGLHTIRAQHHIYKNPHKS